MRPRTNSFRYAFLAFVPLFCGRALAAAPPPAKAAAPGESELRAVYKAVHGKPQKAYGQIINAKAVLDSDETWKPDHVYLVYGPFSTGAHTLTIEAGTVVLFNDDQIRIVSAPHGYIQVDPGGGIKILGTEKDHVVLASFDAEDLYWDGIGAGSNYKDFTIQYADFYKAGAGAGAGAISTLHSGDDPALTLSHVNFYKLQSKGLKIWNETGLAPDSSVTVYGYNPKNTSKNTQYPVMDCDPVAAGTLTRATFATKAGVPEYARVISVTTPMVLKDVVWHDLGIPYRVMELQIPGDTYTGAPVKLTLEPGVTVQINDIIYVGGKTGNGETDMGNLVAAGTKEKPITFTSGSIEKHQPGDWQSIFLRAGSFDPKVTRFDNCVFEYGGSLPKNTMWHDSDGRGDVGSEIAIMSPPRSEPYDGPKITNSIFRKSGGQAVRARTMGPYRLNQLYTDAQYGNKFEDFADLKERQLPLTKE
ncbi:MAG: hypothetical protein HY077_14450 [Elusimicrobia bacterium]|nr:hypothetical protein [Elusimicrobiota bacterium]